MQILILPVLLILLPIAILFLIINYWTKRKTISILAKIIVGILFIAAGLLASFYATLISMNGITENNVQCMTGIIIFIPFGLIIYLVGVPLLLSLYKGKALKI